MALTWRDVAAPDLSGSLQGINQFSRLLDNAFGGAEQAVGAFDRELDEQANRRILERSLALDNSADFNAAMRAGDVLGSDARRASTAVLSSLDARRGQLLNEAVAGQNLEQAQYNFGRQKTTDAALDAASPVLQKIASLSALGTPEALAQAAQLRTDNAEMLGHLRYNDYAKAIQDSQMLAEGGLGFTKGTYDFGRQKITDARTDLDYAEGQTVKDTLGALARYADPVDKMAALNSMKLSPRVYGAVSAAIGGYGGLGGGSVGLPGGGGGAGDPLTRITSGGDGNLGIGNLPPSVKTVGDFISYAKDLNRRGQKSSATGLFQITGETASEFAPKAGVSLNADYADPVVQDKIGKAIFQDAMSRPTLQARADKLRSRWTSLSPQQALAMAKSGNWEQSRDTIMRGESGAQSMAAVMAAFDRSKTVFDSNYGIAQAQGESIGANPGLQAVFKGMGDQRGSYEVATQLAKQIGSEEPRWVDQAIVRVQENVKKRTGKDISALSAAEAIRANLTHEKRAINFWHANALGEDIGYNMDAASNLAASVFDGNARKTLNQQNQQAGAAAAIAAAEKSLADAQAAYASKAQLLNATGASGDTSREYAAVQRAASQLAGLRGFADDRSNGVSAGDFRPQVTAPPPPPPRRTVTPKAPPPKSAATPQANPERAFERTPDGRGWKYNTAADRRARLARAAATPFTAPVNAFARGVDWLLSN